MEKPKYQVGEMIYIYNLHTKLTNGPKLAEVLGYRLDGSITHLVYKQVDKEVDETLPVIFEDKLTSSAGYNARLIYGSN